MLANVMAKPQPPLTGHSRQGGAWAKAASQHSLTRWPDRLYVECLLDLRHRPPPQAPTNSRIPRRLGVNPHSRVSANPLVGSKPARSRHGNTTGGFALSVGLWRVFGVFSCAPKSTLFFTRA